MAGAAQFLDDVVPRLAAHEDTPHRPAIADARRQVSSPALRRRTVAQIGPVAFTRVDDRQAVTPERHEHPARRRHRAAKVPDVVAQHLAEAAALEEVALHVDDEQRGGRGVADELVRLGVDGDHRMVTR